MKMRAASCHASVIKSPNNRQNKLNIIRIKVNYELIKYYLALTTLLINLDQIESIKIFSVGKILLKPVALTSSVFCAYGAAGTIALLGYGLSSNYSSERFFFVLAGLLVAGIDVPLFFISKALWTSSNMTYKTEKWKQIKQ
jgi:hypothetical protein